MFGFFGKIFRRLFKKKDSVPQQPVGLNEPAPQPEAAVLPEPKPDVQRMSPHSAVEPQRPEKICPHCGSPNDKFVHVCWMCKAEI